MTRSPISKSGFSGMREVGLAKSLHDQVLLHSKAMNVVKYQQLLDVKRERQRNDAELHPLFKLIGLTVSLLLITIAMNWRFYDQVKPISLGEVEAVFEDLIEIPISEQPPPPPPKRTENFNLITVPDEIAVEEMKIELDVEMKEEQAVEDVVFEDVPIELEEEKADEIFLIVENWPEPEGGMSSFYAYVSENLRYPASALRIGVTGKVFVKFVVEKDGSITSVEVIKGIGAGCDEEAVRVIQNAPSWKPGKQRGKPVRVYMTVPIHFMIRE